VNVRGILKKDAERKCMAVLSNLEPNKVFHYFEEITRIPHGSGNVEQISDFLVAFAKERGLECYQDDVKNVIMVKEATPGYEEEPVVILQGHMDMVAVKTPDCDIDMRTEGLRVGIDGDNIYAEGTSLGGDDGIAVAYILALFDSDEIRHPRLEAIITVDEEVGMDGARAIDLSGLKGKRMLNLDSEEEGIFLTSCAGGARVNCVLKNATKEVEGVKVKLHIGGLQGGHSGEAIDKERGNSNCLFGRVLRGLADNMKVSVLSAKGGLADNAIPRETVAELVIDSKDQELFGKLVESAREDIAGELATKDPGFFLTFTVEEQGTFVGVTAEDTRKAAAFLQVLPNGVQAMSADMPGLVETSLNLGILTWKDGELLAEFSVRSSVESEKKALIARLASCVELVGGSYTVSGEYPGWKYRVDSPLRDKMVRLYRKMYGTEPKVEAIHAGLECGLLADKIADLDCVSFGPNMKDIHTTEETLSISSTKRVWEYLVNLLEEKE